MTDGWTSAQFSFLGLTAQHLSNKRGRTRGRLSKTNILRELYQGCRREATKLAKLGSKNPTGRGLGQVFGRGVGQSRLPGIPVSSCFVFLCSPRLFRVSDPEDLEAPKGSGECPWTVTCLCPKQGVGAVGRRQGKATGLQCVLDGLTGLLDGQTLVCRVP